MAEITTTGYQEIDQATADIAVALRAQYPGSNDSYCYRQAERLRDAIMRGTRELDAPLPPLDDFKVGSPVDWSRAKTAVQAEHDGSADYGSAD